MLRVNLNRSGRKLFSFSSIRAGIWHTLALGKHRYIRVSDQLKVVSGEQLHRPAFILNEPLLPTVPRGMCPTARCSWPASRCAFSGVCSAGLSTMVHPTASAGASFQIAMESGKFQGMIWLTAPTRTNRLIQYDNINFEVLMY